ncbi:penicillin-binding protein 1A [Herbaspirillum sp. SJZ099]|uniref:penicillin-binding protein 1A n=1 Tax=unclassified Herbaspirillum TaxID=2624150 RepID=UPI001169816F|nr:penicillin-binding protein 1A [Herbaspirillum sp. SJZ102]TQK09172.1 penicillin-binding protein 1A [Herbaspirillum sp. SJZ130]TQK14141.1 penicillin-binding protein 1A [Herbaspirillum sp. SJZ106]TWC69840.1 penicillin-binding protein 1A [Herbaspirillum sp. SJZ099]
MSSPPNAGEKPNPTPAGKPPADGNKAPRKRLHWSVRFILGLFGILLGVVAMAVLGVTFIVALTYPKLPDLDTLTDYRPKIPLRIFSADGVLIGEFGEERRNLVHFKDIPDIMKKAVLAIEDDRFYEHGGVDYQGIVRATFSNLSGGGGGASTITQQVARNFFLTSNEPTFLQKATRKFFYEIPLAWKIENNLTKDQILEVYMNQIYLGQRAYGFASAAQIYFGKQLKDITIAEAAMLAGLPKAPSAYNPVVNPKRAHARQQYILLRMRQLGYITEPQYLAARDEELRVKGDSSAFGMHAEYVAEMARQLIYAQYKDETYTRGLNVFTTITKTDQDAAYIALRRGIIDYERRHGYRGPEGYMELPEGASREALEDAIEVELADHPDSDDMVAAVVLEAKPKEITALLATGEEITISGSGLGFGANLLSDKAPPQKKIRRGAIIRVFQDGKNWIITQMPEVESAFVSVNPQDGAIRSLVGGFDFNRNKFNHVTQAWRQPGSSFKPFIYSSSLEKGLSPATIINDAPLTFTQTGGQVWQPKNYGGKFEGPISMRRALQKSINLVSIRILERVGVKYAQEYITRFGFDADKNPPYLTLALGAGNVTPLQMVGAYSVFANGGYKVNPYLITKVTDNNGNVLSQAKPATADDESNRVIDARNAFIMDSMLRDVVRHGTAVKALSLKRTDLAGKTGTTNDSMDAWFAGYQPNLTAIAWIGYDQPKSLGDRETGGGLALPVWISYMSKVLKDVPNVDRKVPDGIIESGGEYYYAEYPPAAMVRDLGMGDRPVLSPEEEKAKTQMKNELF